jgi:hypothetical protein
MTLFKKTITMMKRKRIFSDTTFTQSKKRKFSCAIKKCNNIVSVNDVLCNKHYNEIYTQPTEIFYSKKNENVVPLDTAAYIIKFTIEDFHNSYLSKNTCDGYNLKEKNIKEIINHLVNVRLICKGLNPLLDPIIENTFFQIYFNDTKNNFKKKNYESHLIGPIDMLNNATVRTLLSVRLRWNDKQIATAKQKENIERIMALYNTRYTIQFEQKKLIEMETELRNYMFELK